MAGIHYSIQFEIQIPTRIGRIPIPVVFQLHLIYNYIPEDANQRVISRNNVIQLIVNAI